MSWDPDQIRLDTVRAAWHAIHEWRRESRDRTRPPGFLISRDQKDALTIVLGGAEAEHSYAGKMLWGVPLHVAEEFVDPPSNLVDLRAAVQEG